MFRKTFGIRHRMLLASIRRQAGISRILITEFLHQAARRVPFRKKYTRVTMRGY